MNNVRNVWINGKELRKILKIRNKRLYYKLVDLEKEIEKILEYISKEFKHYTNHGFSHSKSVEDNLSEILSDFNKNNLNDNEIYFIILGAWFHDIGMLGNDDEDINEIRENHHIRSEEMINNYYLQLKLDKHEAEILGRICRGHRKEDLNSKHYDNAILRKDVINVRFISALIRLADELDITYERISEVIYSELNLPEKSKIEFNKHINVSGFAFSKINKHKIIISALATDPESARHLRILEGKITKTFIEIKEILQQNKLCIDDIVLELRTKGFIDIETQYEVNDDSIIELLIGKNLYNDNTIAIRELLSNSIDACKIRQVKNPDVSCEIYITKNSDEITIEDNGIGLNQDDIQSYLKKIGESISHSKEIKELEESNDLHLVGEFGIGILSSFLLGDAIIIETKKADCDAHRIIISSPTKLWRIEEYKRKKIGTKLTLKLKKEFQELKLIDLIRKYFVFSKIPIYYKDIAAKEFNSFPTKLDNQSLGEFYEINEDLEIEFEIDSMNYELIFFKIPDNHKLNRSDFNIYLNQGIKLCSFYPIFNSGAVIVNLKTNCVDIDITRNKIIYNEKEREIYKEISLEIFSKLKKLKLKVPSLENFWKFVVAYCTNSVTYSVDDFENLLDSSLIFYIVVNYYPLLLLKKGEFDIIYVKDLYNRETINRIPMRLFSESNINDFNVMKSFIKGRKEYIIDVYDIDVGKDKNLLSPFVLNKLFQKEIKVNEFSIEKLVLSKFKKIEHVINEILPKNIIIVESKEVEFPIKLVKKKGILKITDRDFHPYFYKRGAYWQINEEIEFYKELISLKLIDTSILDFINYFFNFNNIKNRQEIIKDPIIYLNFSNPFFKSLLSKLNKSNIEGIKEVLIEYFIYLKSHSYKLLSELFIYNLWKLEKTIADYLNIEMYPREKNITNKQFQQVFKFLDKWFDNIMFEEQFE